MSASSRDLEHWEREPFAEASEAIEAIRRRCTGCPPARVLSAAAAEALPPEQQAEVSAHLSTCASCAELLADLEQLEPATVDAAVAARILRDVARDASVRRPAWKRWVYWVPASLAVVLALVVFLQVQRRPAPGAAATVVAVPAAARTVPQAVPAQTAQPPAAANPGPALEKPAVKLTMLALTWRNGEGAERDFATAIAPALSAFRADRYAEAERLLAGLAGQYPSSVEIPFYQGVCQLFLNRSADAVAALRRAQRLADATFAADASWYLGIALARSGHPTEAKARFAALCRGDSEYAPRACMAAR